MFPTCCGPWDLLARNKSPRPASEAKRPSRNGCDANFHASRKARRLDAVIVFWDEGGYLMRPVVRGTWALRGHTPTLEYTVRRQRRVSAIGMISASPNRRRLGAYYLLQREDSIDETIVVGVLRQMRRHFRCPIIVLWDRLPAHRSKFVQEYLGLTPNLRVEFFPSYAPEPSPVEFLWGDKHDA